MSDKLFPDEKSLFQKRINEIIEDDSGKQIIEDLIKIYLMKQASRDDRLIFLSELYNLVGVEQFADIIELMDGREIKFPDCDFFKETLQIVICYYYKYLKHKSWDEITTFFNDDELSHIKMGIKTTQLNQFIHDIKDRIPQNV